MPLARSLPEARNQVEQLVERFHRNLDAYKRAEYKEEQARVEFINPFFEALGWDVRNTKGYAEPYKDVVHEDAIRLGRSVGAPDYCFRIGGTRKFFLEAKKPSVAVEADIGPAYQLRRYAWSAKLALSILTDFEEFAVYDCQRRPKPSDRAGVERVQYVTYDKYLDKFEYIYGVFARQSVLQGSFDQYAVDTRGKRGTSEVDAEFLKEIEGWREALARNIALRNPNLSVYELNDAVQRTIDRLIFLRMAEDRGIEAYGRLLALTSGPRIYARLGDSLYRQADEKYNSGLFDFQADVLTRSLSIDDKVLKPILTGLYYPQCPYEFSVLPADVLGQVYEQFLGKVIRLTPAHRAVVEEKPEVKKAGGVYYTPSYIVEYIVKQTVGRLVEGKSPRQLRGVRGKAPLRVLDPACGSGSFLLGAYQYLLDHYRGWYEENEPEDHAKGKEPAVYQGPGGDWRLTTVEKKRILLDHIYGVDIDRQAVEVTKLSLLLKVLEGETEETLGQQLSFWHERALPDLDDNIKCGNSLISPDYFEGQLLPDEEEMRRVNPFDWQVEFPEAMTQGGFDAVIGNPPYVFGEYFDPDVKSYFAEAFRCATGQYDTYWLFTEKAADLTNPQGSFGMIVPDALLARDEAVVVRRTLMEAGLNSLYHCGQVFAKVGVSAVVYIASMQEPFPESVAVYITDGQAAMYLHERSLNHLNRDRWARFTIYLTDDEARLIEKIRDRASALRNFVTISRGEEAGKRSLQSHGPIPIIVGEDVARYRIATPSRYVSTLSKARSNYDAPKIVMVKTGRKVVASLDRTGFATLQSLYNIRLKSDVRFSEAYLLGHLNSRLVSFYASRQFTSYKKLFPQFNQSTVLQLPLKAAGGDSTADLARHDKIVALVQRMLDLHKKLAAATIPADKSLYERQIEITDRQIDALVYELYGLTEEEIAIVEAATA